MIGLIKKTEQTKPQVPAPPQKSPNLTTLLAVLWSNMSELLKLKGKEVPETAEYPRTTGHT